MWIRQRYNVKSTYNALKRRQIAERADGVVFSALDLSLSIEIIIELTIVTVRD